jgi:beta-1,4-mannosyl-glycoprotein beta-1,4-N-acetylglucosaminyltransferase
MKIIQVIWLSTEIDILDLTLHELHNIVDKFIIVEFPFDYCKNQRRMCYNENKERFKDFNDKIIHVIDDNIYGDSSGTTLMWRRLAGTKINKALSFIEPNDFVFTTDGDVFLFKKAFDNFNFTKPTSFSMKWFMYWFNHVTYATTFVGTQAAPFHMYTDGFVVDAVKGCFENAQHIANAGCHWTKCGGIDKVIENIKGYPHTEFAVDPDYTNPIKVKERIDNGWGWTDKSKGIDTANWKFSYEDYDPKIFPEYLNQHPEIFKKYFCFNDKAKNLGDENWQKQLNV